MVTAHDLMKRHAESGKRYLWTDAFAVCNYVALGEPDKARALVDEVHRTLGVSGDPNHPTNKGMRIGKPLAERGPTDAYDEELEWERDGQYFHYLTKWMHALEVMGMHEWACELAIAAHDGFVYDARGGKRMYWKMSIDLSRPLVSSMGHHDPLDGFITSVELGDLPPQLFTDYLSMLEPSQLATGDALGIGGLLVDAYRVWRLVEHERWLRDVDLLDPLLDAARLGLTHVRIAGPAERRLGFRELGLAIGLSAIERMQHASLPQTSLLRLEKITRYLPLRDAIVEFWLDDTHRASRTWREHADINDVMLATSLEPSGFLARSARATASTSPTSGFARS